MARKGDNGDDLGFSEDASKDGEQGLLAPTDTMYGSDTSSAVDSSSASYSVAPREPRKSGISKEERAGLIAAARMGDRSALLQPRAEGKKRTGKGEYNPDKFVPTRRIMPVRFSTRSDTGENIDIAPADVTTFAGQRGYAPVTASVEQSVRGAGVSSQLDEARTGTFSAEDPAILRGLTDQKYAKDGSPLPRSQRSINTRLDAKVERHNIVANAIQDRNARRLQEHMERHRPLDKPKVVSEGIRSGQERFRRTDTGQEVATGPNVGPPGGGGGRPLPGAVPAETERQKGREQYAERKEATASRGKILEYSQMSGGDIERGGIPRSEMPQRVTESRLGSESRPYTTQQESNISAQRESLRRQRAAEVQAETERASGKAKRDSRMREAEAARRSDSYDNPEAEPIKSVKYRSGFTGEWRVSETGKPEPVYEVGGRPREQRAALIQASAAMRGRMPLVSTADPEQVNRGARAAAQRLDEVSSMFEVAPQKLQGGGRGPRSFLDPEATAGRGGDLRDAQISSYAIGEDPEQIDVNMSNQLLGVDRRTREADAILAREMQSDAEGRPLRAPSRAARSGGQGTVERSVSDMIRSSKDPYINTTITRSRFTTPDGKVEEGAMSRRDVVAATEASAARAQTAAERRTESRASQRREALSVQAQARAEEMATRAGRPAPAAPARPLPDNAITSAGQQPKVETDVDEVTRRVQAGEDMATVIKEIQTRKSRG